MKDAIPGFMTDERGCLDPYRLAHKGIRVMLARLLESAGRADFADARAREQIRHRSLETVHLLRTHARLEGLFLDPLLAACASDGTDCPRHEHAKLESELFTLVLDLDPPSHCESSASEAQAHGHRFYIALTRLVAHYLLHMADEETRVLAILHQKVDDDVLRRMVLAAHSTMSAEEIAKTSAAIAEAVAPHERKSLGDPARVTPTPRSSVRPGPSAHGEGGSRRARSNRHV
jgi:hypothetical protein